MKNSKIVLAILVSYLSISCALAQKKSDDLMISDKIQAVIQDNIFKTEGYYNWGASIIKDENGKYHNFYARWKREYRFFGWLTYSEVAHAVSDSPSGPWEYVETVLEGRRNGKWDAITAHNPKIKHFDGKYYLYYISTNMGEKNYTEDDLIEISETGYNHPDWKILRPNQRTGVAVSESLNGPWERMDEPLIEPSGPITTLTVNPAIDKGKDSKYYLIVKGDKPNETKFIRNQAVAIADHPAGPFVIQEKPVIDYLDTEDMSVWYDENRERFYGVFHAHSFIGMITSENGTDWEKAANYKLTEKKILLEDGTYLIPNRMERPFVLQADGEPKVLVVAVKKGDDSYSVYIPLN
ncbi:glycoside hydrolase family protein [Portibacter lacus]|nr:glycoside hydrolase family protein [Portibacter lacus]